jgi:hypothetical protein
MFSLLNDARVKIAIETNQKNPEVRAMAPLLRDLFGDEEGDDFSERVVQALAELQRSFGLGSDGEVGPNTRAALSKYGLGDDDACDGLWPPSGASDDELGDHYSAICKAAGVDVGNDQPWILALRGVWAGARRRHRVIHVPLYDDTFVLFSPGSAPRILSGATHPYQKTSGASADLDGDGKGDVALIRPGAYALALQGGNPPIFVVHTEAGRDRIPAFRDLDHDGVIGDRDRADSLNATQGDQVEPGIGAYATEVLLHPGYDVTQAKDGKPFSSIGCQTAPLAALGTILQAGKTLRYVVVDAGDVVAALRNAPLPVG